MRSASLLTELGGQTLATRITRRRVERCAHLIKPAGQQCHSRIYSCRRRAQLCPASVGGGLRLEQREQLRLEGRLSRARRCLQLVEDRDDDLLHEGRRDGFSCSGMALYACWYAERLHRSLR
eukprot:2064185-Prymnesium_polylepis.1